MRDITKLSHSWFSREPKLKRILVYDIKVVTKCIPCATNWGGNNFSELGTRSKSAEKQKGVTNTYITRALARHIFQQSISGYT